MGPVLEDVQFGGYVWPFASQGPDCDNGVGPTVRLGKVLR
jgi:hypothetical protein